MWKEYDRAVGFEAGYCKWYLGDRDKKNPMNFEMITTITGHYGVRLEVQKRENNEIMYMEKKC